MSCCDMLLANLPRRCFIYCTSSRQEVLPFFLQDKLVTGYPTSAVESDGADR